MPDLADGHAAFREAMARAEAEAGISRDDQGNEFFAEQETPEVTPELQGAVPVQASDQPLETEPVAKEAADTSEQKTEEEQAALLAGKYKSIDELERAHLELQQKLGDPDRLDLENRRLQEQIDALRSQMEQPTVSPQTQQAIQITQELIDSDPERATLLAFEQQNAVAAELAFTQWKAYDPENAMAWRTDQLLAKQSRDFDDKLRELQAALDAKTAPLVKTSEEQQQSVAWAQAFDVAKDGRPDFIANAERLLTEVAPQHPSYLSLLQSTDPKVKADALVALYAIDKLGNPEAVTQQLEERAREAAAEADANRAAGAVVSGQQTAGQPTVETTDEELEIAAYKARQGSKPSLARGWTGRS